MDQSEHKNLQSSTQYSHDLFKRKAITQLLLSVSVFSVLFSTYHSRCPFKLLTHTIDKSFVFLICNGILVFIAKTSGLLRSRPALDLNDHKFIKNIEDGLQMATVTEEQTVAKPAVLENEDNYVHDKEMVVEERDSSRLMAMEEEEEEGEGENLIRENEEDEIETQSGNPFEEDALEVLSTEELNKKFDEFIRKMKEELRIDAQRQMVLVQ